MKTTFVTLACLLLTVATLCPTLTEGQWGNNYMYPNNMWGGHYGYGNLGNFGNFGNIGNYGHGYGGYGYGGISSILPAHYGYGHMGYGWGGHHLNYGKGGYYPMTGLGVVSSFSIVK